MSYGKCGLAPVCHDLPAGIAAGAVIAAALQKLFVGGETCATVLVPNKKALFFRDTGRVSVANGVLAGSFFEHMD